MLAKRREDFIILLDILTALLEGPKRPTRLAQTCNVAYDKLSKYTTTLESNKLIERRQEQGHELYSLTVEGHKLEEEFRRNLERLGAGLLARTHH